MKFTIDKSVLYKAVNNVQKAADQRSRIPVLKGILIEANGRSLKLTSTDLSLAIQTTTKEVFIDEIGSALIPAKFFNDVLRKLSGWIVIETFEDNVTFMNKLRLTCGDLTATINTMDPEEFPELPAVSEAKELTLPTKVLKTALSKTAFATSTDDGRPVFTGILFKVLPESIEFISTDTFRLTRFKHPIETSLEISTIVPAKAMKELVKIFDGETVKMSFTEKIAVFECGNTRVISKLIEGLFPNYDAIMPKDAIATVSVSKSILKSAIERASLFSYDRYNNIVELNGEENLVVSGSSSLFGEIKQTVKAEHMGEKVSIAFNCEFLLQAINALTGDDVHINYFGTLNPMTICEDGYIQLILPVRTGG